MTAETKPKLTRREIDDLQRDLGKKAEGQRWADLPYFTRLADGKIGMIRRQCTSQYKIKPIHKKARELERRQIERGKQV